MTARTLSAAVLVLATTMLGAPAVAGDGRDGTTRSWGGLWVGFGAGYGARSYDGTLEQDNTMRPCGIRASDSHGRSLSR